MVSSPSLPPSEDLWKQGGSIPLTISDLTAQGDGLGQFQGRVVFVPNTVPGDQIRVRLVRVKPNYATGLLQELEQASPHRIRPACIVADKCGGCQWQHVDYDLQLQTKQQIVRDALERIGHLQLPPAEPILAAPQILRYRNKVTYPIDENGGRIRIGYFQQGSHRLINLNQCPVQDERLDVYLQEIKIDLQEAGWPTYDEGQHRGRLRHLGLRIGRRTGEVLLTLVSRDARLPELENWAERWMGRYPDLVGVCLNLNPHRTNAIFGAETLLVAGRSALQEQFAGHTIWIDSTSFFQINTEQAETFFTWIGSQLSLSGHETVVDAYCGIGTLSLLLAPRVSRVLGVESLPEAVAQARHNARVNQIDHARFFEGAVETVLPTLPPADVVILDPPRKGCDRSVLETLLLQHPHQIVYISCHPATLARDLEVLVGSGRYRLTQWRAADFFPQTGHVESVAFLTKIHEAL